MHNIISNLNKFFIFRHYIKGTTFDKFTTHYNFLLEDNFYNFFLFSKEDNSFIYFVKQLNIQTFHLFLKFRDSKFDYIIIYEKITSECNKHEDINKNIFLYNKDFFLSFVYDNTLSKDSIIVKILNEKEKNDLKIIYRSVSLNELQKMKLSPNLTILGIRIDDVIKFIRTENNFNTIIYKKIISN